eukprot:sb/3475202/
MPNIKLQSSDGEIFDVDIAIAKQSGTISTMLEDLAMDEEDDDPVPLPNVSTMILKKVITWCKHHKDDPPKPEDEENMEKRTDDIDSWDQDFLKVHIVLKLVEMSKKYSNFQYLSQISCVVMSLDVEHFR